MPQMIYSKFAKKWKNATFPARPCRQELEEARKIAKKHKKALILGATPEFRDICHNLDTSLCDINPTMVDEMRKLMKSRPKETIYLGNWLDMPVESKHFDLILAEQSMNIVPFRDWDKFLKESKRVLSDKGEFFLAMTTILDEKDYNQNLEDAVKDFRKHKRNVDFIYDMVIHIRPGHEKKNNLSTHKRCMQLFKKLLAKKLITKKEFNIFDKKYGHICKANLKLHIIPKKDLEKKLKKYFTIKKVINMKETSDYDYRYHPIYILTKK